MMWMLFLDGINWYKKYLCSKEIYEDLVQKKKITVEDMSLGKLEGPKGPQA